MRKSDTYGGNFLKADVLGLGNGSYKTMVLTISGISSHTFDEDDKTQRVLSFKEDERRLGLNATNWDSIAEISGKDDDDLWVGTVIELWVDKNVTYGGKKIPAIRVRKPGVAGAVVASAPASKVTAFAHWKAAYDKAGQSARLNDDWMAAIAAREQTGNLRAQFTVDDWQAIINAVPAAPGISDDEVPF